MIITCRQLVEAVTDAKEQRLSLLDSVAYRAHLLRCGGCRAYVRQMDATIEAMAGLRVEEAAAPEDLKALLVRKLSPPQR